MRSVKKMAKLNTNDSTRYVLYLLSALNKFCESNNFYFHAVVPGNFPMESKRETIMQYALYTSKRPSPYYIYVVSSYKSMTVPTLPGLVGSGMRVKASHVSSLWLWDWTNPLGSKIIHQHINDYKDIDTFLSLVAKEVIK